MNNVSYDPVYKHMWVPDYEWVAGQVATPGEKRESSTQPQKNNTSKKADGGKKSQ